MADIWGHVVLLSQIIGYTIALTACQRQRGQVQCTNIASPKCCYGTCCPESAYSVYPFKTCSNSASGGWATCRHYSSTSCCPFSSGTRDMGQTCCGKSLQTFATCSGRSTTNYCTEYFRRFCCFSKCCSYLESLAFPFPKCSSRDLGHTFTKVCSDYRSTECCTMTRRPPTTSSTVFCCPSQYTTTYKTYTSCYWGSKTEYCTNSLVTSCCYSQCCYSPNYPTCGQHNTKWTTEVCSNYPSTSCCYRESHGQLLGENCCDKDGINHEGVGPDQTTVGWGVGVTTLFVISSVIFGAHILVKKRRQRRTRRNDLNMAAIQQPGQATQSGDVQPNTISPPPPTYSSVTSDQPPEYDQLPPSYDDVVKQAATGSEVITPEAINQPTNDLSTQGDHSLPTTNHQTTV